MTVHAFHPDVHVYGLVDGCPRCTEHAEHPLRSLDVLMLAELRRRVNLGLEPRSDNEARAMERLREGT